MNAPQPTIYRITMKQARKVVPMLNMRDVWVQDIQSYLTKDSIKQLSGVNNLRGVSGVYVSENRTGRPPHNLLIYNKDYQNTWGGNHPIYGNVIFVLSEKAYNELPDDMKTLDIDLIEIIL